MPRRLAGCEKVAGIGIDAAAAERDDPVDLPAGTGND